jgi:hypothetical protein
VDIMKKIILSVFALTAMSAAAFAQPVKMGDDQLNATVAGNGFTFVHIDAQVNVARTTTNTFSIANSGGNGDCALLAACGTALSPATNINLISVKTVQVNRN